MLIGDGPEVLTKISMIGNDLGLDSGVVPAAKKGSRYRSGLVNQP